MSTLIIVWKKLSSGTDMSLLHSRNSLTNGPSPATNSAKVRFRTTFLIPLKIWIPSGGSGRVEFVWTGLI